MLEYAADTHLVICANYFGVCSLSVSRRRKIIGKICGQLCNSICGAVSGLAKSKLNGLNSLSLWLAWLLVCLFLSYFAVIE